MLEFMVFNTPSHHISLRGFVRSRKGPVSDPGKPQQPEVGEEDILPQDTANESPVRWGTRQEIVVS